MLKKIWSAVLAVAVVVSCCAVGFAKNVYSVSDEMQTALLSAVLGENMPAETETITRAGFLKALSDVMRVIPVSTAQYTFQDVTNDTQYKDYIYTAQSQGWVSPAEQFFPDRAITLYEAVSMSVRVMRYDALAQVNGGYPYGYMAAAEHIELTNGVKGAGDESISYDTMIRLLYNTLNCTMPEIGNQDYAFPMNHGLTFLEKLYDVYYVGGMITDTVYGSLNSVDSAMPQDRLGICIDGEQYQASQDYAELLGYRIDGFYRDDDGEKTVICAVKTAKNNEFTIPAGMFEALENHDLQYYDGGTRIRKVRLSPVFDLVYNGKKVERGKETYISEDSAIKLIDNDNDGAYDVLVIDHYSYVTVKSADIVNELIISDQENSKYTVDLSKAENDITIVYETTAPNAPVSYLKDITAGEVLAVRKSLDEKLVKLYRCPAQISGRVSRKDLDENILEIGDIEYRMSAYFLDIYEKAVSPAKEYTFQLGVDRELVSARLGNDYTYGYMVKLYQSEAEDDKYCTKIFNEFGKFITCDVNEKVLLDGNRVKAGSDVFMEALSNGDGFTFAPQLIRYKLNAEGNVSAIDTAAGTMPDALNKKQADDDKLTQYASSTGKYYYRSNGALFFPLFNLSTTTIFVIPKNLTAYDFYTIGTSSLFVNDTEYTSEEILPYDINESGAAAAVVYRADIGNVGINSGSKNIVVETVTQGVNAEDELITMISGWSDGTFIELEVGSDVDITKKKGGELCTGDILRYSEVNGKINRIAVDFNASPGVFNQDDENGNAYFNDRVYSSSLQYQFGRIYALKDGYIYVANKKNETGGIDFAVSKIVNCICKEPKVAVIDLDRNKITPGTLNDILTYVNNGYQASTAVLIQNSLDTRQIVIYKGRDL